MTEYELGEHVKITANITRPSDGNPIDPNSVTIDVYSPSKRKVVDGEDMTKSDTGEYYYWFQVTDETGDYSYRVNGIDVNSRQTVKSGEFSVV